MTEVPLAGLVYTTDHDWLPELAWAISLRPDKPYPPVHLLDHDGRLHVHDGRHRTVGRIIAGRSTVSARVQAGHDDSCPCSCMS